MAGGAYALARLLTSRYASRLISPLALSYPVHLSITHSKGVHVMSFYLSSCYVIPPCFVSTMSCFVFLCHMSCQLNWPSRLASPEFVWARKGGLSHHNHGFHVLETLLSSADSSTKSSSKDTVNGTAKVTNKLAGTTLLA